MRISRHLLKFPIPVVLQDLLDLLLRDERSLNLILLSLLYETANVLLLLSSKLSSKGSGVTFSIKSPNLVKWRHFLNWCPVEVSKTHSCFVK